MWTVQGKKSIVPTVSPVSVSACAHWPIRKLIAQILLSKMRHTRRARTPPKSSECVKPTPGQPRWNCAGSAAFSFRPDGNPVHEPLGHQVGGPRADREWHVCELQPRVALDRVRLDIVRRPAQKVLQILRTPA